MGSSSSISMVSSGFCGHSSYRSSRLVDVWPCNNRLEIILTYLFNYFFSNGTSSKMKLISKILIPIKIYWNQKSWISVLETICNTWISMFVLYNYYSRILMSYPIMKGYTNKGKILIFTPIMPLLYVSKALSYIFQKYNSSDSKDSWSPRSLLFLSVLFVLLSTLVTTFTSTLMKPKLLT